MKVYLKTEDEIELMRQANQLVGKTLAELAKHIVPGVTTLQLDRIADEFIRDHGAICTSVNEVVVHGVPSDKVVLKDGDIISVDCGTLLAGYNGDSCYTFCVGEVAQNVRDFLSVTRKSLYLAIDAAVAGNHLGDIGHAVQSFCESHGYGIVRELTGHGIGREMHEEPKVTNYGSRGSGMMLKEGMCIAIEPMATMGDHRIGLLPDKWSIRTIDGSWAAHYEHTIAIRKGKAEILSSFEEIERVC